MPQGLTEKNAQARSYYSGFRAVRRRYGKLCVMVSPAASRRAGFFPCMPCIWRVIDGCVNFIEAWYRYEPGLSSSTRRLRYACSLAHLYTSERVIFLRSDKSTASTDIAEADAESAMNEPSTEHCYSTRTFFVACCRGKNRKIAFY